MAKRNKKTLKKISKELKNDKLLVNEILVIVLISIVLGISVFYVYNNQKHTVSFNSNGGNAVTSKKIKHNKKISKCDSPVKEGYEFIGWYYNNSLFDCNAKVTEDIILEARWEKNVEKGVINITFNYEYIEVRPNTQLKLVPIIEPIDVSEPLYWESSDTEVAEVDNEGNVSFKKEGTVDISVSTNSNIKATQQIIVSANAKKIEKIVLSENYLEITDGSVKQLTYTVEPLDATNKNVKWMSDNTSIVSVSQTGEIVAKEPGEAIIVLTTMDGTVMAKCRVKVLEN